MDVAGMRVGLHGVMALGMAVLGAACLALLALSLLSACLVPLVVGWLRDRPRMFDADEVSRLARQFSGERLTGAAACVAPDGPRSDSVAAAQLIAGWVGILAGNPPSRYHYVQDRISRNHVSASPVLYCGPSGTHRETTETLPGE